MSAHEPSAYARSLARYAVAAQGSNATEFHAAAENVASWCFCIVCRRAVPRTEFEKHGGRCWLHRDTPSYVRGCPECGSTAHTDCSKD